MSDIFISYSRKDSHEAVHLAELLASAGFSCWIDKAGIDLATSWSGEIVDAIEECTAFIVLLSTASTKSTNVMKEVALASEKKKKILPLDLEQVPLSRDLQYHLAGIQRAPMTNIDAIIHALAKLGLQATGAPHPPKIVKEKDARKSLMILPFEDLSPAGEDNAWFADGLAGELIDALSHIKSLRILDRKTSMGLRGVKLRTVEIGKEFNTRYFIEGSVRKFGEQIKISVSLLDVETGDHLWQESHRGVFKDIFDIQESVASKVVEALKLHLTLEEKTLVKDRGTQNAEAYELYVKAAEYFSRRTKEGFQLANQLVSEAIKLDPSYASAYQFKANTLAALYRAYSRDPGLLEEGKILAAEAFRLRPEGWNTFYSLSVIYQLEGNLSEAERVAKEYVAHAPNDYLSHFGLGFLYSAIGEPAKAIAPYEEAIRLKPEDLGSLMNLAICCSSAKQIEKRIASAEAALPAYERHLKLHPDDEWVRVNHAVLLFLANRKEDARAAAERLENIRDGMALYNIACLYCDLKDPAAGLRTIRRSIEAGNNNPQHLWEFLNDEEGAAVLRGTPEYEEVKRIVEKMEAKQTNA